VSLVNIDGMPLVMIGAPNRLGMPQVGSLGNTLIDAAKEAVIMFGHVITEDGQSHTIDTTGSSSLGWRAGSVTFANAGTTVKVGLATMNSSSGPPGRAVNATDTITFDVSKSLTGGGGGISANSWHEHVPDSGSKTIANGDMVAFCVQMTALGGADLVNVQAFSSFNIVSLPAVTSYTGGSYASAGQLPNAVITFSDGTLGFFHGGFVESSVTTITWNSGSGTKEYGNLLQFPFPVRIYGIAAASLSTNNADLSLVLYSDPLGTPVAERTLALDGNISAAGSSLTAYGMFSSPYDLPPNTPIAAIVKPTTVTNISLIHMTLNAAAHQKAWNNGANGYAVTRAAGAFAAQNSNKDRFGVGVLVGAFDTGGYPASRMRLGM
jgi:hypothetical protein